MAKPSKAVLDGSHTQVKIRKGPKEEREPKGDWKKGSGSGPGAVLEV